jgi:hypothetical protein
LIQVGLELALLINLAVLLGQTPFGCKKKYTIFLKKT